jgi:hypothetical protein
MVQCESKKLVMPGLVPGIHVLVLPRKRKTWMAGTKPGPSDDCGRFSNLEDMRDNPPHASVA